MHVEHLCVFCTELTGQKIGACHLTALASAGAIQARGLPAPAEQLPACLGSIRTEAALAQIPTARTHGHQTGVSIWVLTSLQFLPPSAQHDALQAAKVAESW